MKVIKSYYKIKGKIGNTYISIPNTPRFKTSDEAESFYQMNKHFESYLWNSFNTIGVYKVQLVEDEKIKIL